MAALLFEVAPGPQQVEHADNPIVVRPGIVRHMSRYLAPVYALPAEQIVGKGVNLVPV